MKTTEVSTITLKNPAKKVVVDLIDAEIKRRPHLKDGVVDVVDRGIDLNFQVADEGVMQHFANALSLDKPVEQILRLIGKAYGRTGKVGPVTVTVWYIEH